MGAVNRIYAAAVLGVMVIAGLVLVNAWLGREVAQIRVQEPVLPPAVTSKVVPRSTGRIPVIDPLSDPLAPVFNVTKPAMSESPQRESRKSRPIYESTIMPDTLLQ